MPNIISDWRNKRDESEFLETANQKYYQAVNELVPFERRIKLKNLRAKLAKAPFRVLNDQKVQMLRKINAALEGLFLKEKNAQFSEALNTTSLSDKRTRLKLLRNALGKKTFIALKSKKIQMLQGINSELSKVERVLEAQTMDYCQDRLGEIYEELEFTGEDKIQYLSTDFGKEEYGRALRTINDLKNYVTKEQFKHYEQSKRDVLSSLYALSVEAKKHWVAHNILALSTRFTRVQVPEIAEQCGVQKEQIIEDVLKDMISQEVIYAQYFESTGSVAFDQQANIAVMADLDQEFESWEEHERTKEGKVE